MAGDELRSWKLGRLMILVDYQPEYYNKQQEDEHNGKQTTCQDFPVVIKVFSGHAHIPSKLA
jgi:hypothetical protein